MAAIMDAAERVKIDDALRLPGLKFPNAKRVLGPKHINLMMALGALDVKRGRAGKHWQVLGRLVLLFRAVIITQEDDDNLEIASDEFYGAAILKIGSVLRDVANNLTPNTLRLVIDLYTQAFARSGWKVIKKPTKSPNSGAEEEDAITESLEILEPIEPIFDCIKLEKLVKAWMRARGTARQGGTTREKPVFDLFKDVNFPQQKPKETLNVYMQRLQDEFRQIDHDIQADNFVLSYVSDQRRERLDEQHVQIGEYEKLLDQRRERLDEQHAQIGEYEKLLDQRRECIDEQHDTIERAKRGMASLKVDFDNWCKMKRPAARDRDSEPEPNLISNELGDKLNQVMVGQDDIVNTQFQLAGEMLNTRLIQGYIEGRQNEVLRRQEEVMYRQDVVMDRQDVVMNGQDVVMGLQDVVMGRQDVVMGRQDVVMDRQDEVIDNLREMMGYD